MADKKHDTKVRMSIASMMSLMGKVVTVTHELRRRYSDKIGAEHSGEEQGYDYAFKTDQWKVSWQSVKRDTPRAGWIVGFRFLAFGTRKDNGTGAYLEEAGRIVSVLVSYSPIMRSVRIALDGYFVGGTPEPRLAKTNGAPAPSLVCTEEEANEVEELNRSRGSVDTVAPKDWQREMLPW